MEECFNCGVSKEPRELVKAISKEGIVKICKECASKENIPIITKSPQIDINYSLKNINKKGTVYERLSKLSGFNPKNKLSKEKKEILERQDKNLKKLIEKNYSKNISNEPKPDFLIDNFHWLIMRSRRKRHLTQEQLAKEIAEPEIAIRTIEKGILPRGCDILIEKIEKYLGIVLTKKEYSKKNIAEISFDPITTKELTIEDLREMKEKETKEDIDNEIFFEDNDWEFDEKESF